MALENVDSQMRMESARVLRAEIAMAKLGPKHSENERLFKLCHSYLMQGKISPAAARKVLHSFHSGRSAEHCAGILHRLSS